MGQNLVRYPEFEIQLITEHSEYSIRYDSETRDPSDNFMAQSVISMTTKNAMEDDSAMFSFVLTGDVRWDRILSANDAIILKVYPNKNGAKPENPVLLVGMISEVRLEGDYGNNSKIYRITGQSFAKAFIQFQLGVIQEVSVVLTDIGWLPNDTSEGTTFTGKNAAQIGESMIKRFVEYMKYGYADGRSVRDFLTWKLESWTDYEKLVDATPFINYEGSLKQLLDDITAKPFNEFFFDATIEGKCEAVMRRTPFDEEDWNALDTYEITSDAVIQESVGKTDLETYSIFNVLSGNLLGLDQTDFGSFPQYHQALVDKYGYRKLEVDNRYLLGDLISDSTEDKDKDKEKEEVDTSDEIEAGTGTNTRAGDTAKEKDELTLDVFLTYVKVMELKDLRINISQHATKLSNEYRKVTLVQTTELIQKYIKNRGKLSQKEFDNVVNSEITGTGTKTPSYENINKFLKDNKEKYTSLIDLRSAILKEFKKLSYEQANKIAVEFRDTGDLTEDEFKAIMATDSTSEGGTSSGASSASLSLFSKKVYNWYCENPNFFSGEITLVGNPDYRLGHRLLYTDLQFGEVWEYYIESVQHNFSYTEGYTTVLGVTRGLQNGGQDRFSNLWGKAKDFKGGLLGELGLKELLEQANKDKNKGDNNSGGSNPSFGGASGSKLAMGALNFGLGYSQDTGKKSVYSMSTGKGRNSNPFKGAEPYAMDCSSFVYWCYDSVGVQLSGGMSGVTTWSIIADPQLKTIFTQGSKASSMFEQMKKGDIVFFSNCNHVGIYAGDGKMVAMNGSGTWDTSGGIQVKDMTKGYWWDAFDGSVVRYS